MDHFRVVHRTRWQSKSRVPEDLQASAQSKSRRLHATLTEYRYAKKETSNRRNRMDKNESKKEGEERSPSSTRSSHPNPHLRKGSRDLLLLKPLRRSLILLTTPPEMCPRRTPLRVRVGPYYRATMCPRRTLLRVLRVPLESVVTSTSPDSVVTSTSPTWTLPGILLRAR
ncbi:unnamed protein product [Musa acuminata subsp. malaccensis]|uniref:(wild Malaysian banana) hypothetical protein n=1 Tax=Musa acuminata subsp. malaccensis TaxID=214687 RepID=A0A804I3F4_MUSAM|nr:unnamed protein product [Musa acuminata subsp. malaccensis]